MPPAVVQTSHTGNVCTSLLSSSQRKCPWTAHRPPALSSLVVASATGGAPEENEPEDAAYNELLARRRAERSEAIKRASARSRFSPLNMRNLAEGEPSALQPQQPPQQEDQPSPSARAPSNPDLAGSSNSTSSSISPAGRNPVTQRAGGAPLRPSRSSAKRKGVGGLNGRPSALRKPPPSLKQRQQLSLATDEVVMDSDDSDGEEDDIDADTMRGLEALAAQLLQEGGLEELDVTVDGERGPPGGPFSRRGAKGTAMGGSRAGKVGPSRGAGGGMRASSASGGKTKTRDPFQVG